MVPDIKAFLDDVTTQKFDVPAKHCVNNLNPARQLQAACLFALAHNLADVDGLKVGAAPIENPLWQAWYTFPEDLLSLISYYEMTYAVLAHDNSISIIQLINNVTDLGKAYSDDSVSDESLPCIVEKWWK